MTLLYWFAGGRCVVATSGGSAHDQLRVGHCHRRLVFNHLRHSDIFEVRRGASKRGTYNLAFITFIHLLLFHSVRVIAAVRLARLRPLRAHSRDPHQQATDRGQRTGWRQNIPSSD